MNVWGVGAFDNDSGKAFMQEVVEDGAFALREAFEVVLDPDLDWVEAEEGWRTLAAAEILSAVLGQDTARLTDAALRAWVAQADPAELAPLRPLAGEALERVLGPGSELPDLWEDEEDLQAWEAEIERLREQF